MSCYWAVFRRRGEHYVRLDTRIYLEPVTAPSDDDPCLGCIVGKNPGSALPDTLRRAPVAMQLSGDRFLPNVRAIARKAHARARIDVPAGAYVQVLNLFYLCDRDLNTALKSLGEAPALRPCPSERKAYAWAWFAWGGDDRRLNGRKRRFRELRAERCFYLDGKNQAIATHFPDVDALAKHTQGMHHEPVVAHLAGLLTSQRLA